jgi:hypothetical protein
MPQIIFIGAGPVGLFTAIQVKLHDPKLDIVMFEKYEEYQRKHVLLIEESSYDGSHQDQRFQEMLAKLIGPVRTNELETQLLSFARSIGISIVYRNITSVEELAKQFPETTIFIGSDGSHSIVRKQIFNDEMEEYQDLQYVVELKYEVNGNTRPLNSLSELLPAMTQTFHFAAEHVGKERDGVTPITVRFFIDKTTFDELKAKGVTFKNPLKLNDVHANDSLNLRKLIDSIRAWLITRQDLVNENWIEGSVKITAINLAVYKSKYFALESKDKQWFLVGDAALAVPYFRALNAGLLSGTQLAKLVHEFFHPNSHNKEKFSSFSKISCSLNDDNTVIEKYQRKISHLANQEISKAQWKNVGVNSAISYAYSSQAVPISAVSLPFETKNRIRDNRMVDDDEVPTSGKPECILL